MSTENETPTDKEMLDWLDKQDGAVCNIEYGDYRFYFGDGFKTAREEIAKAMKEDAAGKRRNYKPGSE